MTQAFPISTFPIFSPPRERIQPREQPALFLLLGDLYRAFRGLRLRWLPLDWFGCHSITA